MNISLRLLAAAPLTGLFAISGISTGNSATVAYFSDTGVGPFSQANAETWGGINRTGQSFAFEVTIDYTNTVASESNPIVLWEAGGSGLGSILVLDGTDLHYFAGNSNTDVLTAPHGMTVPLDNVQIVTAFEVGAGAGGLELLSLYVDGAFIASTSVDAADDWAGGETGSALGALSGTQRYSGTTLFDTANVISYPETDISFNAYWLASSGGPADNTLPNIAVPEPSSVGLAALSALALLRRRRR